MRPRAEFPSLQPALLVALVSVWAALPAVALGCPLQISGAPSPAWNEARQAAASAMLPSDCAHVELEVQGDRGVLTFVTRDGREAQREIATPSELLPSLQALAVTGVVARRESEPVAAEEAVPAAPTVAVASAPAPRKPSPMGGEPHDAESEVSGASRSTTSFAVLGGARGGGGGLISPSFAGLAALALGRWELGLTLALDAQYMKIDTSPATAPSSAVAAGVFVGRREPLGNLFLFGNARLAMAALNDETVKDSGVRGAAEVRMGAGVGAAFPRKARTRMRGDAGFEIVPHALGDSAVTPWWAASLLFGVELGGS